MTKQIVSRNRGEDTSSTNNSIPGTWKQVWKLKVPNKIRGFIWRILSNALPTMSNLFKKNCCVTNRCLICKEKIENIGHLSCFCPWAHRIWFGSKSNFSLLDEDNFDFELWSKQCFTNLGLNDWEKALLTTMLSLICKGRNTFLYENISTDSNFILNHAGNIVAQSIGMLMVSLLVKPIKFQSQTHMKVMLNGESQILVV